MSDRLKTVSRLKASAASRGAYIKAKLSVLIPAQLKALRLKSETPRQEDLAKAAGMKQSRISAMETPGAVNYNLETLVRMASTLKVGMIVKFVSFGEMLKWENDFSQDSFRPVTIEDDPEFTAEAALGPMPLSELREAPAEQYQELGSYQPALTGAASELRCSQLVN